MCVGSCWPKLSLRRGKSSSCLAPSFPREPPWLSRRMVWSFFGVTGQVEGSHRRF